MNSTLSEHAFCAELLDTYAACMGGNYPANMRAHATDLRRSDASTPQEREQLINYLSLLLPRVVDLGDRKRLLAVIKDFYAEDGPWLARIAARREKALS